MKIRIGFLLLVNLFLAACNNNTGKLVPFFEGTTLEGKTINTDQLKGKIVVAKVWATWCSDCIVEIPQLNELVNKYKDDTAVVFVAITDDSKEKIERFLNQKSFNYQHISDAKDIKLLFQPGPYKEIPKHIVVDKNGKIVFDMAGNVGNIGALLDQKIQSIK